MVEHVVKMYGEYAHRSVIGLIKTRIAVPWLSTQVFVLNIFWFNGLWPFIQGLNTIHNHSPSLFQTKSPRVYPLLINQISKIFSVEISLFVLREALLFSRNAWRSFFEFTIKSPYCYHCFSKMNLSQIILKWWTAVWLAVAFFLLWNCLLHLKPKDLFCRNPDLPWSIAKLNWFSIAFLTNGFSFWPVEDSNSKLLRHESAALPLHHGTTFVSVLPRFITC